MYGEARLLSHLVDDLRTLSLADAGELTLRRTPLPTLECLERTAAGHAALAASRAIRIDVQAAARSAADPRRPRTDRTGAGQLVSNALSYTPDGGRVTLSASAAGSDVLRQVSDTGPGIDPNICLSFKRFYRADKFGRPTANPGWAAIAAHWSRRTAERSAPKTASMEARSSP